MMLFWSSPPPLNKNCSRFSRRPTTRYSSEPIFIVSPTGEPTLKKSSATFDPTTQTFWFSSFSYCEKKRPSASTCVPAFSKSGSVPSRFTAAEVLPPPLTIIFWPKKLFVISRKGTASSTVGSFARSIASS